MSEERQKCCEFLKIYIFWKYFNSTMQVVDLFNSRCVGRFNK